MLWRLFSLVQIVFQLVHIVFLIKIKIKLTKSRTIKKYVNAWSDRRWNFLFSAFGFPVIERQGIEVELEI